MEKGSLHVGHQKELFEELPLGVVGVKNMQKLCIRQCSVGLNTETLACHHNPTAKGRVTSGRDLEIRPPKQLVTHITLIFVSLSPQNKISKVEFLLCR